MNPVFNAASESVQGGWIMGLLTLFFLVFFTAWAIWAWAPRNRERMEAAARLPFEDGEA